MPKLSPLHGPLGRMTCLLLMLFLLGLILFLAVNMRQGTSEDFRGLVASRETYVDGVTPQHCLGNPSAYADVADGKAEAVMSLAFASNEATKVCTVQGVEVPGFTTLRACDTSPGKDTQFSAAGVSGDQTRAHCKIKKWFVSSGNCTRLDHPTLKRVRDISDECVLDFHPGLPPAAVTAFVDQLTLPPGGTFEVSPQQQDAETLRLLRPRGVSKTVDGVQYYLIAAHKAFTYSSPVSDTDAFFRNMFNRDYNADVTTLDELLRRMPGDSAANCYANSRLAALPCTGYLLEAYNPDGTRFPAWGAIDTETHTWASLGGERSAVFQNTALNIVSTRLYASVDTSAPVQVGHVAALTTSKNDRTSTADDPFRDDAGDYVFLGLSTQGFTSGDGYDVVTFGHGTTCIAFAVSDGSGVGNKMSQYHRRANYGHCTAMSRGQGITPGRTGGAHGGADRQGIFMVWAKLTLADVPSATATAISVRSTQPNSVHPGLRYQVFSLRRLAGSGGGGDTDTGASAASPSFVFDTLLSERSGESLAPGLLPVSYAGKNGPWGGDAILDQNFGLVLTGFISVPAESTYTFYVYATNGVSLSIDGLTVLEAWEQQPEARVLTSASVFLPKGRTTFRLRFFHTTGHKVLRMGWSSSSEGRGGLMEVMPVYTFSFV